jgi:hypothetical protein
MIDQSELLGMAMNGTRSFIMDTQLPPADEHHVLALLGIPPMSDEVYEMEVEASSARLYEVAHLAEVISSYAKVLSNGMVVHEREHMDPDVVSQLPDEVFIAHAKSLHGFGLQLTLGVISQLVDKGILVVPQNAPAEKPKRKRLFRRG